MSWGIFPYSLSLYHVISVLWKWKLMRKPLKSKFLIVRLQAEHGWRLCGNSAFSRNLGRVKHVIGIWDFRSDWWDGIETKQKPTRDVLFGDSFSTLWHISISLHRNYRSFWCFNKLSFLLKRSKFVLVFFLTSEVARWLPLLVGK